MLKNKRFSDTSTLNSFEDYNGAMGGGTIGLGGATIAPGGAFF